MRLYNLLQEKFMELRQYQQQAVNNVLLNIKAWVRRNLLVLATGLWKTVIFAKFPELVKKSGKKTLILAHREELLTQAKEKIEKVSPELKIGIEQWNNYADDDCDVIIASVATLWREGSERIKRFKAEEFWLIVTDECHHATSSTYVNIYKYFWAYKGEPTDKYPVMLWVTATPNRWDNVWLSEIFDDVAFKYSIKEWIEDGWLANIKAWTVFTQQDISGVKTSMWDFNIWELSEAVNSPVRNDMIVRTYKEICNDKAIVFAVDVQHTLDLSEEFTKQGIKAEHIIWALSKEDRKSALERFASWETQVLVNCMTLTEGFDEPSIQSVLLARPTASASLHAQMIGRGTRLFKDKDFVKVIDFVDNTAKNNLVTTSNIIGLETPIKAKWHMIFDFEEKFKDLIANHPLIDTANVNIEDLDIKIKEVNIFSQAQLPKMVTDNSKYSWNTYGSWFKISLWQDTEWEGTEVLISENTLGKYDIEFISVKKSEPSFRNGWKKATRKVFKKEKAETKVEALEKADSIIFTKYQSRVNMIRQDAKWRKEPPSEKQLALLKKAGYQNVENLSKWECTNLIWKYFAEKANKTKKK